MSDYQACLYRVLHDLEEVPEPHPKVQQAINDIRSTLGPEVVT